MEELTHFFLDHGVIVAPVGRPAVKRTEARLRVNLMATHTQQDIEQILSLFETAYKKYGPYEAVSKARLGS